MVRHSRLVGRFLVAAGLLGIILGCVGGESLLGSGGGEVNAEATRLLQAGDLPGAASEYERLAAEHPDSVEVAIGLAYTQLLAGDTAAADRTLAAIEPKAGDQVGEVRLRRALVALGAKNLDQVKVHGAASGLPEGQLLAAEVSLVDLDSEKATETLRALKDTPGVVGETARTYLSMLESQNSVMGSLAEATALWALGDRQGSCEVAEDLVRSLPADDPDKDAQLLLWAGRAVTSGLPGVARSLIDEIAFPPEGQEWRWQATKAMVLVAEGDTERGIAQFETLKTGVAAGSVPRDGLDDALATACAIAPDPETAKELVAGVESAAAARCLLEVGASAEARLAAPPGTLKQFLEQQ